jgi:alpha-mannosidase
MTDYSGILVANPLPWDRTVSGPVSKYAVNARGQPDDELSARHWQDRAFNDDTYLLPRTEVPGNGYTVVPVGELLSNEGWLSDERRTVETDAFRITFDRERGGIAGWWDKHLGCEWVDETAEYPLAGVVQERLADENHEAPRDRLFRAPEAGDANPNGLWNAAPGLVEDRESKSWESPRLGYQPDWRAERYGPERVTAHRVYRTSLGYDVRQSLTVSGLDSAVDLRVFVPDEGRNVVVEATWVEGRSTHPSSTYLAFPLSLSDPEAHVDVGGQAMRPGRDQLSGCNRDFYTVQRWTELSNDERGMTVGCPLNPLVQFGDFHFGENREEFALDRALVLGWVATNYYNTNFRAHQPGVVRARYHLRPHEGSFDEARAHRAGAEADHWGVLAQPLADGGASPRFPRSGRWFDLPEPPVLVLFVRPAGRGDAFLDPDAVADETTLDGQVEVGLLNASDDARTATVASGVLEITGARAVGVLGEEMDGPELDVDDDCVVVDIDPRMLRVVRLSFGGRT